MKINTKLGFKRQDIKIEFPCTEQTLKEKLAILYLPENLFKNLVVNEVIEPEWLKVLETQSVSMDQLNYLAKRLDVLSDNQCKQFEAAMKHFKLTEIKDLINLTFNLSKYTFIEDVQNLENVGRIHFENLLGGLGIDEQDEENCNFAEIGRQLLDSGKGIAIGQGILFENDEIEYTEVYNGRTFPQFVSQECLAIVEMKYGEDSEYLYLPCEDAEIFKAQMRLNVFHIENCEKEIVETNLKDKMKKRFEESLEKDGIYEANEVVRLAELLLASDNSEIDATEAITGPEMAGP